jgi:hypothetical protein
MIGPIWAYSVVADTGTLRAALAERGRNPPAVVKRAADVPREIGDEPGYSLPFLSSPHPE